MKPSRSLSSHFFESQNNMKHIVLISNNLLEVSAPAADSGRASQAALGTVLANFAHYGFAPSIKAVAALKKLPDDELGSFWKAVEPALKELTGANRNMAKFVVYKNFPKEVLAMSQAEYWFNQICMYLGAPNDWYTQEPAARPKLDEELSLKVLSLAGRDGLASIYAQLVANKARWTDAQRAHALWLVRELAVADLDLQAFGFKENGLTLIANTLDTDGSVTLNDATDVLRLAAVMSGADAGLRADVKFKSFGRAERRFLLSLLEDTKNLRADIAARQDLWKRLLARLHPGDFKFNEVQAAYDALYKGELSSFNAMVEAKLAMGDASVVDDLKRRPGDFARRVHALYAKFGMAAAHAFAEVAPRLKTGQLLKLRGYLRTVNNREKLIFPPKGNWSKAKFVDNEKKLLSHQALKALLEACDRVLDARMGEAFPEGVDADPRLAQVKLQTNDQELAPYGRGTVFNIPENVTFIRTASYWACKSYGNIWYDNGVCFFDENWGRMGTCCWNATDFPGAVFSGDPTNSKDLKGRACQMIDFYPKELVKRGVRYAVWNVLCFSQKSFEEAEDVLATLQWGENAESGKLFEPARAQMVFPLKGKALTKFVAYIDLVEMKLVYMDANFGGEVQSAKHHEPRLAERMPAFVEYLAALPSVADLVAHAPAGVTPMLYSDEERALGKGVNAYVFKPVNAGNDIKQVDLVSLL